MNAVLAPVQDMERSSYLGSSDVAALMGVSKWKTRLDVYLAKVEPEKANKADPDKAKILRRGHRLEPFIVQMAIDALRDEGHQVELLAQGRRYVHPDHPFIAAEIDAELLVDGEHVNLEAKSANRRNYDEWGDAWTDEIPIGYAAQVSMAQGVNGIRTTIVAAIFGLDDVVLYRIEADDELNEQLIKTCADFWHEHVLTKMPPAPENLVDIARMYRTSGPPPIEATDEIVAIAAKLKEARTDMKRLEDLADQACFELLAFMGESDTLLLKGKPILSAKHQVSTMVDGKRLQREQADIHAQYQKSSVSRPILFKKVKP